MVTEALNIRGYIQKFPNWVDNEIYAYNNKHSLRSNTKGYGGKTHWNDSQNSDTIASSGRVLYHLQFSLQAASPETFGYTLVLTAAMHSSVWHFEYRNWLWETFHAYWTRNWETYNVIRILKLISVEGIIKIWFTCDASGFTGVR
jgi:hypothetical protein